jgi:hypothetical protein
MAHKNKKTSQLPVKNYLDLFYMSPAELNAKDIASLLKDTKEISIQLWEEMNVLEIELPNENSLDFEPIEASFQNPSDASFIKNRNIKTIFAININEADLNTVIPYFEQIVERYSGFFCADSDDFTPVYAGSATRPENK